MGRRKYRSEDNIKLDRKLVGANLTNLIKFSIDIAGEPSGSIRDRIRCNQPGVLRNYH